MNINDRNNLITLSKWIKRNKNLDGIQISGSYQKFINNLKAFVTKITTRKGKRPHMFQPETTQRNDLKSLLLDPIINPSKNEVDPLDENDLSICDINGNIRVIIEYKRSIQNNNNNNTKLHTNSDMMHISSLNCKAFQELVSYYLREKMGMYKHRSQNAEDRDPKEIIGIVTDGLEWFVLSDASLRKYFLNNHYVTDIYRTWCGFKPRNAFQTSLINSQPLLFNYRKSESTKELYSRLKYFIDKALQHGIQIGYINISQLISNSLLNLPRKKFYGKLMSLYRFLSQQCLLGQDVHFPPNKLNAEFYNELLYIMGLRDKSSQKGISLIPKSSKDYCDGSLIQLVYSEIDATNKKEKEKHFSDVVNITMSLVDRLIFLKLLEGQLISIHNDKRFKFVTTDNIKNFSDLSYLFFKVMDKWKRDPHDSHYQLYKNVPYLNSSLFSHTSVEHEYGFETKSLDSKRKLNLYKKTTLRRDEKRNYLKSAPYTLTYLINFLNNYKFRADSHINSDRIINASILGMIFEKINGYKDGSYYTPTIITDYIAKNTIDNYLLTKVNDKIQDPKRHFHSVTTLRNHAALYSKTIKMALENVKILDPAVGSGHFLVSALNYLLYLENYLGMLLLNNFQLKIKDGRLLLQNAFDGSYVQHKPKLVKAKLFTAKVFIIKYNLYGVDINPNSVNIAKLRLWIELLKDAYYKKVKDQTRMITMPNLETNIKSGDSICFSLGAKPLKEILQRTGLSFPKLKTLINNYKSDDDKKDEKRDGKSISIAHTKLSLMSQIQQLWKPFAQTSLNSKVQSKLSQKQKEIKNISKYIQQLNEASYSITYVQSIQRMIRSFAMKNKINIITDNFEWRYEFPDIFQSKVTGFDIITTNPPYVKIPRSQSTKIKHSILGEEYAVGHMDLLYYFIYLAMEILKPHGIIGFITTNYWLTDDDAGKLRSEVKNKLNISKIINFDEFKIFRSAMGQHNMIIVARKEPQNGNATIINTYRQGLADKHIRELQQIINGSDADTSYHQVSNKHLFDKKLNNIININLGENKCVDKIINKLDKYPQLSNYIGSSQGIKMGPDKAFTISKAGYLSLCSELTSYERSLIHPLLSGSQINNYVEPNQTGQYVIYTTKKTSVKSIPHLSRYIRKREAGHKKYNSKYFYALDRPRTFSDIISNSTIFAPRISKHPFFVQNDYGYLIKDESFAIYPGKVNPKALLILLNSSLARMVWIYRHIMEGLSIFIKGSSLRVLRYTPQLTHYDSTINDIVADMKDGVIPKGQIQNEIDELVCKWFRLNDDELKEIDKFIKK